MKAKISPFTKGPYSAYGCIVGLSAKVIGDPRGETRAVPRIVLHFTDIPVPQGGEKVVQVFMTVMLDIATAIELAEGLLNNIALYEKRHGERLPVSPDLRAILDAKKERVKERNLFVGD